MSKDALAFNLGDELKLTPSKSISQASGYATLGEFISRLIPNVYVIASLLLFVLLLGGGLVMIASAGNPQNKAQGSKAVTSAIIGFAVIFCSFWLIKIIEYLTGIRIFNPNLD